MSGENENSRAFIIRTIAAYARLAHDPGYSNDVLQIVGIILREPTLFAIPVRFHIQSRTNKKKAIRDILSGLDRIETINTRLHDAIVLQYNGLSPVKKKQIVNALHRILVDSHLSGGKRRTRRRPATRKGRSFRGRGRTRRA